jgi:hypothetical protein
MSSGLPTVHNAAKVEVTPPRVSASLRGAGSPRMAVFCHPKSVETTHVLGGGKLRSFAVTGSNSAQSSIGMWTLPALSAPSSLCSTTTQVCRAPR